jgi:hypothetical protein
MVHHRSIGPTSTGSKAVILRNPTLVGVEQPALRELPAWRPTGEANEWGRGYIDLIGSRLGVTAIIR